MHFTGSEWAPPCCDAPECDAASSGVVREVEQRREAQYDRPMTAGHYNDVRNAAIDARAADVDRDRRKQRGEPPDASGWTIFG